MLQTVGAQQDTLRLHPAHSSGCSGYTFSHACKLLAQYSIAVLMVSLCAVPDLVSGQVGGFSYGVACASVSEGKEHKFMAIVYCYCCCFTLS